MYKDILHYVNLVQTEGSGKQLPTVVSHMQTLAPRVFVLFEKKYPARVLRSETTKHALLRRSPQSVLHGLAEDIIASGERLQSSAMASYGRRLVETAENMKDNPGLTTRLPINSISSHGVRSNRDAREAAERRVLLLAKEYGRNYPGLPIPIRSVGFHAQVTKEDNLEIAAKSGIEAIYYTVQEQHSSLPKPIAMGKTRDATIPSFFHFNEQTLYELLRLFPQVTMEELSITLGFEGGDVTSILHAIHRNLPDTNKVRRRLSMSSKESGIVGYEPPKEKQITSSRPQ